MLQTIAKAAEVLSLFDRDHKEWGVQEVADRLDLAKSSAHDLMTSLAGIGFLTRTSKGRYQLGWSLVGLSEVLLATTEIRLQARPILEEIAAQSQETVHLAILDDTKVAYVDRLQGGRSVRVEHARIGTRLYPHCSATGKVLLAHCPPEEVTRIINIDGLPRFTPNTITDAVMLTRELAEIRKQGYAYDREEVVLDQSCVGAPIHDYTGKVVAAISVSMPTSHLQRADSFHRSMIVCAAARIEDRMGYYRGRLS